jgi:hypothetical protein
MKRTIITFAVLTSIVIFGCTHFESNNKYDKDAASSVAITFYNKCRNKNYDEALSFLDSSITQEKRAKIKQMLINKDSVLGRNHWSSLMKSQTFSQTSTWGKDIGRYELIFQVAYDKDTLDEYFRLIKNPQTDSIKIVDYQVTRNITSFN